MGSSRLRLTVTVLWVVIAPACLAFDDLDRVDLRDERPPSGLDDAGDDVVEDGRDGGRVEVPDVDVGEDDVRPDTSQDGGTCDCVLPPQTELVSCERCAFRCAPGFVDRNDDLATLDGDGCECRVTEVFCDGLDEDCDGDVDEGLLNACGECGDAPDEVCDGVDNDCDREIDESSPSLAVSCIAPEGAVYAACVGGRCRFSCQQGRVDKNQDIESPVNDGCECVISPEICDGIDNDCDGDVDELNPDLLTECSPPPGAIVDRCEQGECRFMCENDRVDLNLDIDQNDGNGCECFIGEEICDGIDNDCDGEIDENLLNSCGFCGDVPLEACDGVDNDCDGAIDEPSPSLESSCPLPQGAAYLGCESGRCRFRCLQGYVDLNQDLDGSLGNGCECVVSADVCDGLDNNCDGAVDEPGPELLSNCLLPPGAASASCDQSRCRFVCEPGRVDFDGDIDRVGGNGCECVVIVEYCDGVDNDCDGDVDEGLLNACGECGDVPDEVCDGIDNDCDQEIDESSPLLNASCSAPEGAVYSACVEGQCLFACQQGRVDRNQDVNSPVSDGCECVIQSEICDGFDNDCDGAVDEGLNCPCEGVCQQTLFGGCADCVSFSEMGIFDDTTATLSGEVTLRTDPNTPRSAWLVSSNWTSGELFKIDTTNGRQVGRYALYGSPSRTGVDSEGNAIVAHRNHGVVVKIANFRPVCETDLVACGCVDRNGNGRIDTARDADQDGLISNAEMIVYDANKDGVYEGGTDTNGDAVKNPLDDECVLWTSPYVGAGPRAVSIAPDGFIWVGDQDGQQNKLDPDTGAVLAQINTSIPNAYGSVMDSAGRLWFVQWSTSGCIQYINTANNTLGPYICQPWGDRASYGIALDGQQRIWLATYCNNSYIASRYDPINNYWVRFNLPGGMGGCTRGITVDRNGVVWVSHWTGGYRVSGFDSNLPNVQPQTPTLVKDVYFNTSVCNGVLGLGVGGDDDLWTACYSTARVVAFSPDPASEVQSAHPIGAEPYVYSDFTGNLYQTFTLPEGRYSQVIEGCMAGQSVSWSRVSWSAVVPEGASVEVRVRIAATREALATAVWTAPWIQTADVSSSPASLTALPADPFLEVQLLLHAGDGVSAPRVSELDVRRFCQ